MSVWIVDDNPLHQRLIKTVLKEKNIKHKSFYSLKDIKKYIDDTDIDHDMPSLVLIDLQLGFGERGEKVLNFLKNTFKDSDIKYVAFTAEVERENKLYNMGFDKVIYKPVTREKLKRILGDLINGY